MKVKTSMISHIFQLLMPPGKSQNKHFKFCFHFYLARMENFVMRSVSDLLRVNFIDQWKSWQKIHNFPRENSRSYFYLNYATPDFLLFMRKAENNAVKTLSICSERELASCSSELMFQPHSKASRSMFWAVSSLLRSSKSRIITFCRIRFQSSVSLRRS